MRILIARHAEDLGPDFEDKERKLTKKGIQQAKELGEVVRAFNPTHLYCSTMQRSKQTTEIISEFCQLEPTELDYLKEQVMGPKKENKISNKGYISLEQRYQGGESYGLALSVGQAGNEKLKGDSPIDGLFHVGCDAGGSGLGTHQAVDSGINVLKLVLESSSNTPED